MSWFTSFISGVASGGIGGVGNASTGDCREPEGTKPMPKPLEAAAKTSQVAANTRDTAWGGFAPTIETKLIQPPTPQPPGVVTINGVTYGYLIGLTIHFRFKSTLAV